MTEGLELPFQWDDGNFISPFVSSSDDAVAALAAWMHDSPLLPPHKDALRLTDLGCGDGQALFALSANLFSLRGGSSHGDASPLQLTVVGLDLDETLVNAAQQRAGSTVVVPPHQLRCVFESVDVRHCDVDRYFPLDEARSHVLFLYLLPEGLETIREKLLEAFRRVRLLVSNRWDVPFLAKWKIGQVQMMHIYHYSE